MMGKSLRELQKARQESRTLRDVAFMYGSALRDQDTLIKHYGAGWILPKEGIGAATADGKPGELPKDKIGAATADGKPGK